MRMVWASVYAAWGIPKPRNVIESRAVIFREVDKFDLWNTQLTIKASNQRGLKTYNRYTFAPTIDQPGMPD